LRIIGLTGGIGTGKSTVARFLAGLGARVIDVDRVGHRVLARNHRVRQRLVETFGEDILHGNMIDRSRLGRLVFADKRARKRLNGIIHPVMFEAVKRRVEKYRREGAEVVVLDAPLLLEAGWDRFVDEVWVTVASPETVNQRAKKRSGLSGAEVRARVRAQIPREEQAERGHVVIDTDCPLEELKEKVESLWRRSQLRV